MYVMIVRLVNLKLIAPLPSSRVTSAREDGTLRNFVHVHVPINVYVRVAIIINIAKCAFTARDSIPLITLPDVHFRFNVPGRL